MSEQSYASYEEAANDYMRAFVTLRQTPAAPEAAVRAAGDIPANVMIDQADEIAGISAQMLDLSTPYLSAPEADVREGMSAQYVAQATAELQLATELLQVSEEEQGQPVMATRGVRGVQLRQAISELQDVMARPIAESLPSDRPVSRAAVPGETRASAIGHLKQSAEVTTSSIIQRVQELGGDIALDLFMKSEWSLVAKGASLVREDLFEQIDELKEGASALIKKAVAAAAKNLLNAYDKILALAGKNIESKARKKVQEWLEQIKEEGTADIFETLVAKFYRLDDFKAALEGWLADSSADQGQITTIAADVDALAGKFSTLTKRLALLETAIVLAKFIKIPQVLLAIAAIQIALLAVVVYAGYDYIGYGQPRFPNLTKGVGEVIEEGLQVT